MITFRECYGKYIYFCLAQLHARRKKQPFHLSFFDLNLAVN